MGGVFENQHLFCKLLTFWPDFYYFHGDLWHSKNVDVYSLLVGGGGLRKCMVCTLVKMLNLWMAPKYTSYIVLFMCNIVLESSVGFAKRVWVLTHFASKKLFIIYELG